jgi:hypothetical protein
MTKKESPKTTIGITPAHAQQLDRLALEMGLIHARRGNVSRMMRDLADLVRDFGPRVVAAALQPAALAVVAEGMQEQEAKQ